MLYAVKTLYYHNYYVVFSHAFDCEQHNELANERNELWFSEIRFAEELLVVDLRNLNNTQCKEY